MDVPALDAGRLYPKERALGDLVRSERDQGRRTLVYVTHTGRRDITGRLDQFLSKEGLKVAVLKADTVTPERREMWVNARVSEGVDVVVCHPGLVQTGLDLIDFPTIVWFETHYSVYVMRQASRRSWRIGQKQPVKVIYMAYRGTLQADALKLVARKLQSSLAVEGDLPEEGLAVYGDDGKDVMMALARQIVQGETDEETVEEVFARSRTAELEAEDYLVDDGWALPPPEDEEPLREAPEQQPAAAEAGEHQQLDIFSLADFINQEPSPDSKSRRRRPEPSSQSLFEWALNETLGGGGEGSSNHR